MEIFYYSLSLPIACPGSPAQSHQAWRCRRVLNPCANGLLEVPGTSSALVPQAGSGSLLVVPGQ